MPRVPRCAPADLCYHVLNRGNARATVFHGDADYRRFVDLLAEARRRAPMRIVGYCLMPNHVHLVLWPRIDDALGAWMQWLLTTHVRRHHGVHRTGGHVWQGRYKSFPVESDAHLVAVLRYVEANPVRARLVESAVDWPWSSHRRDAAILPPDAPPVTLPADWTAYVDAPQPSAEIAGVRTSVGRGAPYGRPNWVHRTAEILGLASALRPRGRPPTRRTVAILPKEE
jgi:putative transposase